MKFGVREICDVVFKAKSSGKLGSYAYGVGQPVLYIDSAKTSTIEGAATTVYATGGKGNSRLIAWEGERTLTFTVEDALLSPVGFAILSGAGLMNASTTEKIHVHATAQAVMSIESGKATIDLTDSLGTAEKIDPESPIFVMISDRDGSLTGDMVLGLSVDTDGKKLTGESVSLKSEKTAETSTVFVDFYIEKTAGASELTIDAGNFAGYYYVEASTLFRRQIDGKDMPAEIVFPNVKIQSNFTFTMASSGDPSTFTFTMDAFPGYTMFNNKKKVLCAIQIVEEEAAAADVLTDSTADDESDVTGVDWKAEN